MQKCSVLMKLDYNVTEITNSMGELSSHYPSTILIPDYELQNGNQVNSLYSNSGIGGLSQQQSQRQETIYESNCDGNKLRDLINKARFARYVELLKSVDCASYVIVSSDL